MTTSIDWRSFIERSSGQAHRSTRLAVEVMGPGNSRTALDIGSGNGRDALFMAEAGFSVSAVDDSASALVLSHPRVTQFRADIVEFPLQQYAMINASLVLPFIDQARFKPLWQRLLAALTPSGVIAGHLSGVRDWKVQAGHAWGCSLAGAKQLLSDLAIVSIEEHELDGPNISGAFVHKHNFEFVAQKCVQSAPVPSRITSSCIGP